jgi:hypothetical protein
MNFRNFACLALLALAPVAAVAQTAIGEVALVTGSVTVGTGAEAKGLGAGDPIFEGQTITVARNSYASLKFADGGRVLLRPDSEFVVEQFKHTPAPLAAPGAAPAAPAAQGPSSSAFFRLVRGGFRAISGLIGKVDRQSYKVTTPVATIGIRGTDYEVQLCGDDCPTQKTASAAGTQVAASDLRGIELAQADAGSGVIVATHEGTVEVRTPAGQVAFTVDAGQVGVMMAGGQNFMLPLVPDALIRNPAPSPASCD